ncbi:hypothetical protein C4D60_Mb04t16730 [Musa balbisiana]|uniref:Uncharacterized protein n=1 Tax=Musa balbisiana TaxID=52838 RepID=A0A4S8KCI8_MUSBA|nr:hypothetical protein C4D60_Mb04t16730 [Musa balbisiana]
MSGGGTAWARSPSEAGRWYRPYRWVDQTGNVTVVDAGKFDGSLGIICAISALKVLKTIGKLHKLSRPVEVNFTVDIRAMHVEGREAIESEFSCQVNQICDVRMVNCTIERKHTADAAHCNSEFSLQLKQAAHSAVTKMPTKIQGEVPVLMSGAGHDAMAISHLYYLMLFGSIDLDPHFTDSWQHKTRTSNRTPKAEPTETKATDA